MVTQEPHLCENCGHVDPLELPYCGFCGHPNETATDEQREAAAAATVTPPSAGTAAAAADLADLITGPTPEDSDFDFNADAVPEAPAATIDPADLPAGVEAAVQWGDPGEWAEPPPPEDPFAEDFTGGAAAPVSDPIQEALLTGTVTGSVAGATAVAPGSPAVGAPTAGGTVPPSGVDWGLSGQSPASGGGGRKRSRTLPILVGFIVLALVIAVVVALASGGKSNPSGSSTTTTSSASATRPTTHTSTSTVTRGVVVAGTASAPWTNVAYPQQYADGHLFTLSCATANACWAVGANLTGAEILATTDGGTTWVSQTIPSSTNLQNQGHLFSIFCVSASACETVGTATSGASSALVIMGTTNGGDTWTQQTYPSGLSSAHLFSVYCASATVCWGLGGLSDGTPIILATTNGGSTWAQQTYPGGLKLAGSGFLSIGCSNTQECFISASGNGGLEVLATTNGGATWSTRPLPAGLVTKTNGIGSISCGTTKVCVITGFSNGSATGAPPIIVATSDGGATWHVDPYPSSLGLTTLTGVWCTGPTDCWALGNDTAGAVIVATHDAGKTWGLQSYPESLGKNDLVSISCPTTTTCWIVAVGTTNTPLILAARKS